METQYEAAPGVWFGYKKFSKQWNLFPNYVCKTILFPTEPKAGVRVAFTIENNEGVPIDVGMNFFQFTALEEVHPSLGEQGTDW